MRLPSTCKSTILGLEALELGRHIRARLAAARTRIDSAASFEARHIACLESHVPITILEWRGVEGYTIL
jgi:hypothetical protein